MVDDSPTSSQGSDTDVGRSCRDAVDSEDEDVVGIHRHETQSGRSSPESEVEFEHRCSIVADSDFRYLIYIFYS